MAKVGPRQNVSLQCQKCGKKRTNYVTSKNKRNTPDRLEIKKYCPWCKEHTMHKESK